MDKFFETIHKKRKQIHLTEEEQDVLDTAVLSFVDAHPLPDTPAVRKVDRAQAKKERMSVPVFSFGKRFAYAAFAVVVLAAGGASTVIASEKSLPGETLYSVKVNVAEEIRSALTFDPEDKAEWEATRVGRRLEEIKILLEDGSAIEKHVISDVEDHIESHSQAVAKAALSLQMRGDTKGLISLVDQLQLSLETYGDVLAKIVQEDKGAIDPKVVALFESVEKTQQVAKAAQLNLLLGTSTSYPDNEETTGGEAPTLRIHFPVDGDTLVMGTSYDVSWSADITAGSYMSVTLIDMNGDSLGYIGAVEYPASSIEWNPKYVLDITGAHQAKDVASGMYRLRLTVRDVRGTSHQTESGVFEIIRPSIATGVLHIDVIDGVGNPIPQAYIEINKMNQKRVEVQYTDTSGRANVSLLPGTYTIVATSLQSDRTEEQEVYVAEVGEQYVTMTLRATRTTEEVRSSGVVDLIVTDISASKSVVNEGEPFTVTYVVENIGNPGIAGKRTHALSVLPALSNSLYTVNNDITDTCAYQVYLTTKDRCVVTRSVRMFVPGTYALTATIDSEGFISELREDNNSAAVSVTVGKEAPEGVDIEITSPSALREFFRNSTNENLMTWTVHTSEATNVPATINLLDEHGDFLYTIIDLPALFKGSAIFNIPENTPLGQYYIEIRAGEYTGRSEQFSIVEGA